MLYRRILGRMTLQFHKTDLQLKGGIGEQTDEVCLCCDLQRHQVQDDNPQRTDILCGSSGIIHDEDILILQNIYRRKLIG